MSNNADNVRVAITGNVYNDPTGDAEDPTGTGSDLTGWDSMGFNDENGVNLTMPGAGTSTPIKVWQEGATVRVLRAAPEETPGLEFTMVETKIETIELAFGVKVEPSQDEGHFVINTNKLRQHTRIVVDTIDGDELQRIYAPQSIVTAVESIQLFNTGPIAYKVTLACEYDQKIDGHVEVWSTALKTPV